MVEDLDRLVTRGIAQDEEKPLILTQSFRQKKRPCTIAPDAPSVLVVVIVTMQLFLNTSAARLLAVAFGLLALAFVAGQGDVAPLSSSRFGCVCVGYKVG